LVTLTKPRGTGCSQDPHQPEEMLGRAPANVNAASTAKSIAISRSATRDIRHAAYAGADTVVAGSAISGHEGFRAVIGAMRAALEG
jgi:hypothetical protein